MPNPAINTLLASQMALDRASANAANGGAPITGANGVGAVTTREGNINRTVLTLAAMALVMADNAGVVAYGSKKIADAPEGRIRFNSVVYDLALQKSSAGIIDAFDGDIGIGTTAADNTNTLASTEQNIVATASTPQAASGSTTVRGANTTPQILDGSTTPVDLYLNLLIDDTDHDVTGTPANVNVTGTVTILWENLGG